MSQDNNPIDGKIEFDSLGNPYCPTLKRGRANMKFKARCVGCEEKCDMREEVEAIISERAKKNPVVLLVGSTEHISDAVRLFSKTHRVIKVIVKTELLDDVGVLTLPDEIKEILSPTTVKVEEVKPPANVDAIVEDFKSKIDIKKYLLRLEAEKRKDKRQQHKFALRQSNRFRKK